MAAFEAQRGGRLRHVPAVLLELAEDKFPLVSAARFMQRGIGMLGTFGHATEEFRRQVMRLDARLRTNDHQPLDEVPQFAYISWPGMAQEDFHRRIAELP